MNIHYDRDGTIYKIERLRLPPPDMTDKARNEDVSALFDDVSYLIEVINELLDRVYQLEQGNSKSESVDLSNIPPAPSIEIV